MKTIGLIGIATIGLSLISIVAFQFMLETSINQGVVAVIVFVSFVTVSLIGGFVSLIRRKTGKESSNE